MPRPGAADNLIQFRNSRLPAEFTARPRCIADEPRGIARPPVSELCGNAEPRDTLHRVDHLANRKAAPVSEIVGTGRRAALQGLKRLYMSVGEIGDVNIVADAGSVRCRVIRAEDCDIGAAARYCVQDKGDEMGFGIVGFACLIIEVGAGCIEIELLPKVGDVLKG